MLFDIHLLANWNKIGTIGNDRLIATWHMKTEHVLNGITKLAIKCLCKKMVFSARQKADMIVIIGPSCQFKRMEQSGFNSDKNQNT